MDGLLLLLLVLEPELSPLLLLAGAGLAAPLSGLPLLFLSLLLLLPLASPELVPPGVAAAPVPLSGIGATLLVLMLLLLLLFRSLLEGAVLVSESLFIVPLLEVLPEP